MAIERCGGNERVPATSEPATGTVTGTAKTGCILGSRCPIGWQTQTGPLEPYPRAVERTANWRDTRCKKCPLARG